MQESDHNGNIRGRPTWGRPRKDLLEEFYPPGGGPTQKPSSVSSSGHAVARGSPFCAGRAAQRNRQCHREKTRGA